MSTSYLPEILHDETGYTTEGNPKLETGWLEVSRGLFLVLMSHFIAIIATILFVWLVLAVADLNAVLRRTASPRVDWKGISLLVGTLLYGVAMLISYVMMLIGQWRCLYAPERAWAKTYMFLCILCILAVPAVNIAAGLINGFDKLFVVDPDQIGRSKGSGQYLQLAGAILALSSSIFFILFLRAVAMCFHDTFNIANATVYLVFTIFLALGSTYLMFSDPAFLEDARQVSKLAKGRLKSYLDLGMALWVFLGTIVSFLWYLWLIISVRGSIQRGLEERRVALASLR